MKTKEVLEHLKQSQKILLEKLEKINYTENWESFTNESEKNKLLAVYTMVCQLIFILEQEDIDYSFKIKQN